MSTADIFNRFMCDHGILRSRICKVCVRAFRIELLERAVVAIAGRTDGGGNAWLLCTDHATAFDGAGYSTVKLAKLAKLAKRDPW